jgi:hypothetical protein
MAAADVQVTPPWSANQGATMTAAELAAAIVEAQVKKHTASATRIWAPQMTPATDLGYRCERRIVYLRTLPDKAECVSVELDSIFEEGRLHQTDVRRELAELGFEVVEAETNFRDANLEISGTIDGKIAVSGDHHAPRIPLEIKSTMGEAPSTVEAWRAGVGLVQRYYAQIQIYLYLTSSPEGIGLWKNKATGLWSTCAAPLDYEYAETLLRRAESVRDHVRARTLPDRILDRSECNGCPWANTVCLPADAAVDPMLLVEDAALLAQLIEREAVKPASDRYNKIDDEVKARFKLTAGSRFVVGGADGFEVVKKPHGKGVRVEFRRLSAAK